MIEPGHAHRGCIRRHADLLPPRQAEDALADDVALDLRRAARDRRGLAPEPLALPLPPAGLASAPRHSGAAGPARRPRASRAAGSCPSTRASPSSTRARARCRATSRDSVRQLCSRRTRSSTNDCASASLTSTSSRRPRSCRERVQLVEVHLVHDLLLERERGARARAPASCWPPPSPGCRPPTRWSSGTKTSSKNTSLNSASPGDLHERPDLDARRLHVDDEVGDPLVLRELGIGAGEADAPPRELRVARPHLLAVEHPPALDRRAPWCAATRGRDPASGSLKSWHQISLGVEDRREPPQLLLVGAVREQRRTRRG